MGLAVLDPTGTRKDRRLGEPRMGRKKIAHGVSRGLGGDFQKAPGRGRKMTGSPSDARSGGSACGDCVTHGSRRGLFSFALPGFVRSFRVLYRVGSLAVL